MNLLFRIRRYFVDVERRRIFFVLLGYAAIIILLSFFHEPWRDEGQAWLLARDTNLFQLFDAAGYEGSPVLWHVLLKFFTELSLPFWCMQAFHLFLAIITGALLLFRAPFQLWQKIFILSGYFFLYEYAVIARSYVLVGLFLFLLATVYEQRFQWSIRYCILIAFLAQTTVMGLIMAGAIGCFYFFELFQKNFFSLRHILGGLLAIFSGVFAVYLLLPPVDISPHLANWELSFDFSTIVFWIWIHSYGFFPFPEIGPTFWQSPGMDSMLILVTGIFTYFIGLLLIHKKTVPLVLFFIVDFFISFVYISKSIFGARHFGMIVIFFFFVWWISFFYTERKRCRFPFSKKFLSFLSGIFLLFLFLPIIPAVYYEVTGIFSGGNQMGQYLAQYPFEEKTLVVGYPYTITTAVLPFSSPTVDAVYAPEINAIKSFAEWDAEQFQGYDISFDLIQERAELFAQNNAFSSIVYLLNEPVSDEYKEFYEEYLLDASYLADIVISDSFYLYVPR